MKIEIFHLFQLREINIVLEDLLRRCNASNNTYENFYNELRTIIERIVCHAPNFVSILALESFLPCIGLFKKDSVRIEVCKGILKQLMEHQGGLQDPVHVNALMHISKSLNDSVK